MSPSEDMSALQILADKFHCRVVSDIPDAWVDPELIRELPVDYLRAAPALPVRLEEGVHVCLPDPALESTLPELSVHLGGSWEPLLVPSVEIRRAIDAAYARLDRRTAPPTPVEETPTREADREDLLRQSESAPVAGGVNRLLLEGLRMGASDIHVEPTADGGMSVRFRVDGVLLSQSRVPSGQEDAWVSRVKIMAGLDVAERRLPQDGNAKVRVGDREVDIRVSCLPVSDGERLVLRLLGRESTRFSLEKLGMPQRILGGFQRLISHPHGVIWVTGPTGSGKTTTLYAALQELDTRRWNILTIEDPVEYQLPGIGQVAVQPRIGLTFSAGLRALLRQDPDVILVGETRDEETADIVVRASMTGHLVLSTLHANDTVSASLRLTDMGVEPFLVAEATRGALAQRLVRRLCPHCKEVDPNPMLPSPLKNLTFTEVYRPVGCSQCREGYIGRQGLFELLELDPDLRELIRKQAAVSALTATASEKGFSSLWHAAGEALQQGWTSAEELLSVLGQGD